MKVLLVDPPGKNKGLNTGLAYLSAILKGNHEVKVLDLNNIKLGLCGDPNPEMPINELEERIIRAIDRFEPELFGVSVKTFTAEISKHIYKFVHSQRSKMLTIVGGPHITLDGFQFIQENRIDFGIQGEGEYATLELCNALAGNRGIEDVEGLFYWRNGHLANNPIAQRIKDLDAIPFPYYDNFSSVIANRGYLREYPLLTSRGCPYKCSYCSMPKIMGRKWRCHSPIRVIRELQHAKQRYHTARFTVVDDNFTLDLKRVEDICDELISKTINLPWNSQNGIRADRISEALAKQLKRSGCKYVWIGIESADDKVFKSINKGEKLRDIEKGIKQLKKARIRVGGFFIVGLPHSTRETDLKSIDFVKEQRIDGWWFIFVPYPHTQAWNWVKTHAKVLRPINGALQFGTHDIDPVFETKEYPKESRMKTYNEIHIKLKHFDRLVDPSFKQSDKWPRVYKMLLPYGFRAILRLLMFILKYNAKLVMKTFRK